MNYICDLDPNIYRAVVKEIAASSVIITDRKIEHIRERHPDISGTIIAQLSKIIFRARLYHRHRYALHRQHSQTA